MGHLQRKEPLYGTGYEVAKDAGPADPLYPALGAHSRGLLYIFHSRVTSEELKGEITGAGNSNEPFVFSCAEVRPVSFSEDGERLMVWDPGCHQLSSGEEHLRVSLSK